MYKILSINAGGVRGYLPLHFLKELEADTGKKVSEMFDLVVGTSVGALIGAGLDYLPASHMLNLFKNNKIPKEIFSPNHFSFNGLIRPKYNTDKKLTLINEIIPEKALNIKYAFTAFNIALNQVVIFNNLEDIKDRYLYTTKYTLRDAVASSTAAPIFWDPYKINKDMICVDGSYVSSDPTSVGIKLALNKNRSFEDLLIVNLGTGLPTKNYKFKSGANHFKWVIPTIEMMLGASANYTRMLYHQENINYFNFDINLRYAKDSIDDISKLNLWALDRDAKRMMTSNYIDYISLLKKLL